jgi:long-subunit acyl-CoA synthetase (AMP-forming)
MVAVGGASVGAPLVLAAQALGLPVFEGYGLSEGASVQCLNLPGASRAGSVGRPLPHVRLRLASDGELWVQGSLMLGYLGDEPAMPAEWPTGDLARIDEDGFVFIEGRKKNVLITSFGRNVSPEWVETVLRASPGVREVVVLGDGQAQLSTVIWPMSDAVSDEQIASAVQAANTQLPDYAQLCQWLRAEHAFRPDTGMSTANGRPQRSAILQAHAQALGFSSSLSEVTP